MPKTAYALEWLEVARKNLETAKLLFRENHFTDVIAIEIHQTIEKAFKSVLAYNGTKVIKTHNLLELIEQCDKYLDLKDFDLDILFEINDYYENTRYPGPKYNIPSTEEIEKNLQVAIKIFNLVNGLISFNNNLADIT